jgi:electron transfer flavoprotein alpha subunit
MSILVWIEQANGNPVTSSWEVLGKGQQLAQAFGVPLVALVIGEETESTAALVQSYGADTILTMTSPVLANYRLSAYSAALKQAIGAAQATVLLAAATVRGREVSATVACDLNAGLAPDVVDLRAQDGQLVAVRSIYSGNILADVTFDSPLQVATVRPRSFPLPEASSPRGEITALTVELSEDAVAEQVSAVKSTDTGEVNLTDAKIIASGGRGVASDPAKGFALVADLASVLGAAVGASRAAVDAGYIPYKHQVGQTGKTVRPDLYIAAGISGSIQHLAGMGGSKIIVAINKDREAPIFERANYGIVGDLFEVLPALAAEFRKRLK